MLTFDKLQSSLNYIRELSHTGENQFEIASEIASLVGCLSIAIVHFNSMTQSSKIWGQYNIDPDWQSRYNEHYQKFDPSLTVLQSHPCHFVPEHITQGRFQSLKGRKRLFYNELMIPQKYHHTAARLINKTAINQLVIICTRSSTMGEFSSEELCALNILSDEIARQDAAHQKLISTTQITPCAIIGFDKDFKIRIFNKNNTLDSYMNEIFYVDENKNKLHFTNTDLKEQINCFIRWSVTGKEINDCELSFKSNIYSGTESTIQISMQMNANIFVLRIWCNLNLIDHDAIKKILTPAEYIVLTLYKEGYSPADIADKNCRSIHTIRTQIKRIKKKLDVNRLPIEKLRTKQ